MALLNGMQASLKKMVKKKVRLSSHIHFLEKCYKQSLIPKGFSWKWRLNLDADETFIKKIESIKRDASLKLMEISLTAYQEQEDQGSCSSPERVVVVCSISSCNYFKKIHGFHFFPCKSLCMIIQN